MSKARVFRIQAQCKDGKWLTAPGDYHTEVAAVSDAPRRCTKWRIVTGSGIVVRMGPHR